MRVSKWQENESSLSSGYQIQRVARSEPWSYEEHYHRGFCEIVYVLEGALEQVINGRTVMMQSGDMVLLRADDRHALSGCNFSYANIMFPENWLSRLEQYTQLRGQAAQLLTDPLPPRAGIAHEHQSAFCHLIDELISNCRHERGRLVFSYFLMLAVTRHLAPGRRQKLPADMPDWLLKTVIWMQQQPAAAPGIAELVRYSCRSQEHFTRCFSAHMGMTPSRYLAEMRIEQAAVLLSATNHPVQEVSNMCGFANESYFYRLFKKLKGMPPLAFRRKHGSRSIQ